MRVRPFFWIFLAFVCAGILIFSASISASKAMPMQARIDQISAPAMSQTSVLLVLTDTEGEPIDQASITPDVHMPTMQMGPQQMKVKPLGQGHYLAQIRFSMAGFWQIDIIARADGFNTARQSIQLTVL